MNKVIKEAGDGPFLNNYVPIVIASSLIYQIAFIKFMFEKQVS